MDNTQYTTALEQVLNQAKVIIRRLKDVILVNRLYDYVFFLSFIKKKTLHEGEYTFSGFAFLGYMILH